MPRMAHDGQTSINIPQLIAVAVVGFLAIRWFMSKPNNPTSGPSSSSRSQAVDVNKINQVSEAFPQLDRRSIAWDLNRNGGNVQATMERVLGGRALETPPPSFQPNIPAAPGNDQNASSSTTTARKANGPAPDLITRYNLQSRISGKGKEPVLSEEQKRNTWSADKNARAAALKKRREEMILAARRKMEEKNVQA